MKKALIITYYWPPNGGSGVQRWLKFVKYFRDFGWEPIVYTPSNPEYITIDNSLMKDIPKDILTIRTEIWEPYSYYKKIVGKKKTDKIQVRLLSEGKSAGIKEHFAIWVRGNCFIPDARKFWVKPSAKFLTKYLKENPVDAIISTGPPHSMHLIALALRKSLEIPWLADFRDPWTKIDYHKQLHLSALADRKHHRLEREVLKTADEVVTVSNSIAKEFELLGGRKVQVVTNGYDEDDFKDFSISSEGDFVLAYMGNFFHDTFVQNLWSALRLLVNNFEEFSHKLKIRLIGKIDYAVRQDIIAAGLEPYTEFVPYLPHEEALREISKSSLLLLTLAKTPEVKGIITGKLFEYLALQVPILCIGPPHGDCAGIIAETEAGKTFDYDDIEGIKGFVWDCYQQKFSVGKRDISKFSRKNLTAQLVDLLERIVP